MELTGWLTHMHGVPMAYCAVEKKRSVSTREVIVAGRAPCRRNSLPVEGVGHRPKITAQGVLCTHPHLASVLSIYGLLPGLLVEIQEYLFYWESGNREFWLMCSLSVSRPLLENSLSHKTKFLIYSLEHIKYDWVFLKRQDFSGPKGITDHKILIIQVSWEIIWFRSPVSEQKHPGSFFCYCRASHQTQQILSLACMGPVPQLLDYRDEIRKSDSDETLDYGHLN